jgi:hypothetical protein
MARKTRRRRRHTKRSPVSPRRDRSGQTQRRGARRQRRSLHKMPRRRPSIGALEIPAQHIPIRGLQRKDCFQANLTCARDELRRGQLEVAVGLVAAAFDRVATVPRARIIVALAATRAGRFLRVSREKAKILQSAMLCRREPNREEQDDKQPVSQNDHLASKADKTGKVNASKVNPRANHSLANAACRKCEKRVE